MKKHILSLFVSLSLFWLVAPLAFQPHPTQAQSFGRAVRTVSALPSSCTYETSTPVVFEGRLYECGSGDTYALATGGESAPTVSTNTSLSGSVAAFSPGTETYLMLNPAADTYLLGVVAGSTGKTIRLHNNSANAMVVVHDSPSASSANRIYCPTANSLTLPSYGTITLFYAGSNWRVVAQ